MGLDSSGISRPSKPMITKEQIGLKGIHASKINHSITVLLIIRGE